MYQAIILVKNDPDLCRQLPILDHSAFKKRDRHLQLIARNAVGQ